MPNLPPKGEHPGTYFVRPDRNTSIIFVAGLAVFAWLASQWASGVSSNSEDALEKAREAAFTNTQQSQQLDKLPDRIDDSIKNAVMPLQQRLDDVRAQAGNTYSIDSAQRDRAENQQQFQQMRAEINANQNSIQATTGRVDSLEKSISEVKAKLDQIYQAVLASKNGAQDNARFARPIYEPPTDLWQ